MGFSKILCPVDFSPASREALRVSAQLAKESSSALVLAHVFEPSRWVAVGEVQLAPDALQNMLESEESELASWKSLAMRQGAGEVVTQFLTGVAWNEIVNLARNDRAIDLVVMGTHGRTGLAHVLVGSVAEKVVRHAPCNVMIVRPREGK